jgi:hypothetical protein
MEIMIGAIVFVAIFVILPFIFPPVTIQERNGEC